MNSIYSHADLSRTTRVLLALLPEGCSVQSTSKTNGLEISIAICGARDCRVYEFGPGLTDRHLLIIADTWRSGEPEETPDGGRADALNRLRAVPELGTRNDLAAWARAAKRGDKRVYFRGNLAQFRHDAPLRVAKLQTMADKARRSSPRPASEGAELVQLQERLDLLTGVQHLHEAGTVELVQSKIPDGSGATYYVVRR